MTYKSTILGKLFSVVIMAGFVLYVLPNFKPSFFSLVVLFIGVLVISESFGRYFSGENTWHILIPASLVVLALGLLFTIGGLH